MSDVARHWREIVGQLLKLGATAYGGPAIMGVMQAELQERRQWVTRPRFVEGLSLVNMLPGATAVQLSIFLGWARGGLVGGLLAGVAFVLPGFLVMLTLTAAYAAFGGAPALRGALYGLGPVVLGIFVMALVRLGRTAVATRAQVPIAAAAAATALLTPIGSASILLLGGAVGVFLRHSRRAGVLAFCAIALGVGLLSFVPWAGFAGTPGAAPTPTLPHVAAFFFKLGAFTFGGGLMMIAFIQEQLVSQFGWITAQEFLDGLALGQLTPGPVLVVAAYVGYKVAGLAGAVVAAAASFLPAFALMLAVLPVVERIRAQAWVRAAMTGIGPAVIGVLAVALVRLAPHAVRDALSLVVFVGTILAIHFWRTGSLKLMLAGSVVGVVRTGLARLAAARAF